MSLELKFSHEEDRPIDLISMGRVAVDLYAEQIGSKLKDAQTFRKYLGGCAGNIAVGSARLGLNVSMLSCAGADEFGDFLRDFLVSEGVDTKHFQKSNDRLTGLAILGVCPPEHFPLIFFRNDCADIYIDKSAIDPELFLQAKALLITGTAFTHQLSKSTTLGAIKLAKERSCKIIFDIDFRPVLWKLTKPSDGENRFIESKQVSDILQEIIPKVDLIVGTVEEINIAGGHKKLSNSLARIRELSNAPIVVKKGVDGCEIYFGALSEPLKVEPFKVKVLNVLGAGDAFMSGLLSKLLTGSSFSEAGKWANACGALVVTRHSCAPAMPSKNELNFFIKNYQADDSVLNHPRLALLHEETELKNHFRKEPLPIMAFCHRWQLENDCNKLKKPLTKIKEFKTAIALGIERCVSKYKIKNPCLLTDPDYGEEAIEVGKRLNAQIILPIEKSGSLVCKWMNEMSAYEILLSRPQAYGVKVLWYFHPLQPDNEKEHQIFWLKELYRAAKKLNRRLMIECLLAPNYDSDEKYLLDSVQEVYRANISPYWWKLPEFKELDKFKKLCAHFDEFDPSTRLVLLGGSSKKLKEFELSFSMAKTSKYAIGFAVGRSIFSESWRAFIHDEIASPKLSEQICEAYYAFYKLWQQA